MAAKTPGDPDQRESDRRHLAAKAASYPIGSLASGIAAILVAAGSWAIEDATIRYALTVFGVAAFFVVLVINLPRR
jgi:hypothetical protein